MRHHEIDDEAKGIISALAGIPYVQEYVIEYDANRGEVAVIANRDGPDVSLRASDLSDLYFATRGDFHVFVEKLKTIRDDCTKIYGATRDYTASLLAKENESLMPVERGIVYEFHNKGLTYQVIFSVGRPSHSVSITTGDFLSGKGTVVYMHVIDKGEPTDVKAAEAHLKAYLLKKAGIKCDDDNGSHVLFSELNDDNLR